MSPCSLDELDSAVFTMLFLVCCCQTLWLIKYLILEFFIRVLLGLFLGYFINNGEYVDHIRGRNLVTLLVQYP